MRSTLALIHRYVGLVMAGFLLLAGLTGSLLAWNDELEGVVDPAMFKASPATPDALMLDPLVLREHVLKLYPDARINYVSLAVEPGRALPLYLEPKAEAIELANDQVTVHPYTGEVLGERKWGDLTQGLKNLMPFIYRLHYSLALGTLGSYAFGIVALLWTLDCFVGAYLTFPARVRRPKGHQPAKAGKSWFKRWKPSWKVRWDGGPYKLKFDLHRAGGLWPWAMLFVLGWSSVAFNLREVYEPVMRAVFAHQPDDDSIPMLAKPQPEPGIPWGQARNIGRGLMAAEGRQRGFRVDHEDALYYDSGHAMYRYSVHSSLDIRDHRGMTQIWFDANTGARRGAWLPTGQASGDTIRVWLTSLHMAALWGWPFKLFMSVLGLAVALLSYTGVVIWWKKRQSRLARMPARDTSPSRVHPS